MSETFSSQQEKLALLVEQWGLTEDQFVQAYAFESVVPGICMAEDCEYSTDVEPDQTVGWCADCDAQSVTSGLVLAGMV